MVRKDDVLTLLVHLGYLAYDFEKREGYIPNQEVADEFKNAVENSGWKGGVKWDETAEGAIRQIKEKKYTGALKEYVENLLLVGINYDKKSKKHTCVIEKYIR